MAGRGDGGADGHGISVNFSRPVRDLHGHPVWRVKIGSTNEKTCLDCGETTTENYCLRCAAEADVNQRNAVIKAGRLIPTLSYLRPNEYERSN